MLSGEGTIHADAVAHVAYVARGRSYLQGMRVGLDLSDVGDTDGEPISPPRHRPSTIPVPELIGAVICMRVGRVRCGCGVACSRQA